MASITKTPLKVMTKDDKPIVKRGSISKQSSEKMISLYKTTTEGSDKDSFKQKMWLMMNSKKKSFNEYRRKQLEQVPLFQQVFTSDNDSFKQESLAKPSMLMTGFGMRNLQSLQDALRLKEDERQR